MKTKENNSPQTLPDVPLADVTSGGGDIKKVKGKKIKKQSSKKKIQKEDSRITAFKMGVERKEIGGYYQLATRISGEKANILSSYGVTEKEFEELWAKEEPLEYFKYASPEWELWADVKLNLPLEIIIKETKLKEADLKEIWKADKEKEQGYKQTENKNVFLFCPEDKNGNKLKPQVSIDKVCDYLLKKNNFKTIYGKTFETCYVFQNGIYVPIGKEFIFSKCENLLGSWCKNNVVNEIFSKIKRQTVTPIEETKNKPLHLIPLENGLFNLNTEKLEEHNSEYFFTKYHPIIYDIKAECPLFKKFILEALPEEDINSLQELFGFAFYRSYFLKKCFIFVGVKDTGKTVLLTVLSELVGIKNICGLPLETIASADRMRLYFLYDKTLNVYDDLNGRDIADAGGLKVATGGGLITAEEKFGDLVQFYNYAKLLFACNKIPVLKDTTDEAYYSRWMPYEFLNFVPVEEQDPNLLTKLLEEKQGIFNWALEGLERLLKNKRFSYNKSEEEVKRIMQSGDPLINFVSSALIESEGDKISKEDMHKLYSLWADQYKKTKFSIGQLGRALPKICNYLVAGSGADGRYWKNVKFNETLDTLDTFKKNTYNNLSKQENSNKNDIKIYQDKSVDMYKNNVSKTSQNTLSSSFNAPKDITSEYLGVLVDED